MNVAILQKLLCVALLLSTLLSGLWLSHSGRPLSGAIFTIHKLIALATVIAVGISLYQLRQVGGRLAVAQLSTLISSAVLFLALFVSGALLSREMAPLPAMLRIHQVAPLLVLAASMASLHLLAGAKP